MDNPQTEGRLLQCLLLALFLHVSILIVLTTSVSVTPLPNEQVSEHFHGVAIMKAHTVNRSEKSVPQKPKPIQTPPPMPVHGETGIIHPTAQPLKPIHRATIHAAQMVGPKTADKVPARQKPVAAIAQAKSKPHIDSKQAEEELNDIQTEASQIDAEKAAEAKAAAEDAAERLAANKLAQQQASREQTRLLDTYRQRIIDAIRQHWIQPLCAQPDMFVVMTLQLLPDGSVVGVVMNQPNNCLALSVRNAIDQVGNLPVPEDADLFEHYFRTIKLRFRPLDN